MSRALLRWTQSPELVLLDAQLQMIIKAQKRLARIEGAQAMFSVGTAEALPFSNRSFDAVLMVTVLGEVDDIFTTLGEVRRVLAPQGILSVTEHLPDPDFRSVTAVRKLLVKFGFTERDFRGSRWSYTVNATRIE